MIEIRLGAIRRLIVVLITTMVTWSFVPVANAITIDARINVNGEVRFNAADGTARLCTVQMAATCGTWSIHDGANVVGATPANQIAHVPIQVDPANSTFPTTLARGALQTGADKSGLIPLHRHAVPTPVPGGYATEVKDLSAGAIRGVAPRVTRSAGGTTATAVTTVTFSQVPDPARGRVLYTADPTGTEVKLTKTAAGAPFGMAGTLVLDPLFFGNVGVGDVLSGKLSLRAADFLVQIDNPAGVAASLTEVGTNFPASTNPIPNMEMGNSFQGLPLVYSLNITFSADNLLMPDIFFAYNTGYTFLNPNTLTALDPLTVDTFVRDRIRSQLLLNAAGDTVTIGRDLDILEWAGVAAVGGTNMEVDYLSAQAAAEAPEPSTLLLLGTGLAGLGSLARGRRLR